MTDLEKFNSFTAAIRKENERKYGAEIQSSSRCSVKKLRVEECVAMQKLAGNINDILEKAVLQNKSPYENDGKELARLHKKWYSISVCEYSSQAHLRLAERYITSERFLDYYDKRVAGCAAFLHDAIVGWINDGGKE